MPKQPATFPCVKQDALRGEGLGSLLRHAVVPAAADGMVPDGRAVKVLREEGVEGRRML